MGLFLRRLPPAQGGGEASLREHIVYLQNALEDAAGVNENRLRRLEAAVQALEAGMQALEAAGGVQSE